MKKQTKRVIILLAILTLLVVTITLFSKNTPGENERNHNIQDAENNHNAKEKEDGHLWKAAKKHIKNCNVKKVFQRHDRTVKLTLKNGEIFQVVEPKIDEVFKVLQESKQCGDVIMSTE
ncbi:MAG: hypothetical protein R6V40_03485 [Candidatus Moraniibacteriota bacterium]